MSMPAGQVLELLECDEAKPKDYLIWPLDSASAPTSQRILPGLIVRHYRASTCEIIGVLFAKQVGIHHTERPPRGAKSVERRGSEHAFSLHFSPDDLITLIVRLQAHQLADERANSRAPAGHKNQPALSQLRATSRVTSSRFSSYARLKDEPK